MTIYMPLYLSIYRRKCGRRAYLGFLQTINLRLLCFTNSQTNTDLFIIPLLLFFCFPCGSAGKEFTCNEGDLGSIPGLGRSPGERKAYLLQYSGLENSMDCMEFSPWGHKDSDMTEQLSLLTDLFNSLSY